MAGFGFGLGVERGARRGGEPAIVPPTEMLLLSSSDELDGVEELLLSGDAQSGATDRLGLSGAH